ncbi:MAG: hypothetical protein KF758_14310 [Anaerolineales bacterium]|nr:hypothetical protein [Anaerolineales bacterium]MBX3038081.1 hypothetical protein [Anaerolineales bacterium]
MLKAGLISGAVMFLFVLIAAAGISPLCAFCVPLITGLGAGYLNGVFEKDSATVVQRGAYAGAIAGGFGIVAQMIAAIINAMVMQNPEYQINEMLGLPTADPTTVWVSSLGMACFVGFINIGLTAGLGAGGGAIWRNTAGKSTPPSDITPA